MTEHAYVSSAHCRTCKATYARRWRAVSGGKSGIRQRASQRDRMAAAAAADPNRFKPARGLMADLNTGTIYGDLWKPLGSYTSDGYIEIDRGCTDDGRGVMAHRVVWEAAHGPIPAVMEINHLNGVKDDNRLANLEMCTREENVKHAYETGLASNAGERHPASKLTEAVVLSIRHDARNGASESAIAAEHGVSVRCIRDVIERRTWSHLEEEADASCL